MANDTETISAADWPNHSSPLYIDNLALIISTDQVSYSLALTTPRLLPYRCFDNRLIVLPEKLKCALTDDQAFAPLYREIRRHSISISEPDELSLLCYFYLNLVPSSITLINKWFINAGTQPQRASELATLVYSARTERDDKTPDFITESATTLIKENNTPEIRSLKRIPRNLTEAFNLLRESDNSILTYDSLGSEPKPDKESTTLIELNQLAETGFLIEDHSLLILGLSVSITELARLTEHKWPLFLQVVLNEIPLYQRDFYSLGRLLNEKPEIILKLQSDYNLQLDVISLFPDGNKQSSDILKYSLFAASRHRPEIPIFLRIHK